MQGRGLGRKLLAHAERVAASLGHAEVRLYTNKLFAGNVRLHQRLGYGVDREEASAGGVAVHMSKPVQAYGQICGAFPFKAAIGRPAPPL